MLIKFWKRLRELILKYPLASSLLYSFIMFLLVWIFAYPCWETSDDFLISGVLSGMSGEGSPYVLVINYPLSCLLYILGQWFPQLNWLTIFELFSVWISFGVCIWILIKQKKNGAYIAAFVMPLIFETTFYMSLQYTRSTILMAFTGLFLIYYCSYQTKNTAGCIMGGVLFVLGSLTRYTGIFLAIPYIGLWVVIHIKDQIRAREFHIKRNMPFFLWTISALTIAASLNQYHEYAYSRFEKENTYIKFNSARAKAYDYLPLEYETYEAEFEKLGISLNDYEMLRGNMIYDDYFDMDLFKAIAKINASENDSLKQKWDAVRGRFWKSFSTYGNGRLIGSSNAYILFFLAAAIALIFVKKQSLFPYLCILIGTMMIAFYFIWTGRFPPWVQDSLFFAAAFSFLFGCDWKQGGLKKKVVGEKIKQVISSLACIGFVVGSIYVSGRRFAEKAVSIVPDEQMCFALNYMETDMQNIYLIDNFDFCPYPIMDVYGNIKGITAGRWRNIIRVGSWYLKHPVLQEQLEATGLESPIREIVRDDVYLFTNVNSGNLNRYKIFLEENYGISVTWEMVKQWEGYAIYSFKVMES